MVSETLIRSVSYRYTYLAFAVGLLIGDINHIGKFVWFHFESRLPFGCLHELSVAFEVSRVVAVVLPY